MDKIKLGCFKKHFYAYIALSIGIILSLLLFIYSRKLETKYLHGEFNLLARDRASIIINGVLDNLDFVKSIAHFYAGSVSVERNEFHEFTRQTLTERHDIYEFRWLKRVSGPQRQAFEETASRELGYNFYIKDRAGEGDFLRAPSREEYFPVFFIEPGDAAKNKMLGFDAAGVPERLRAMKKACATGEAVIVPELVIFGESKFKTATRIYIPVYLNGIPHKTIEERLKNLTGFAVVLFNMEAMADILLKDMRGMGIDTYVYDEALPAGKRLILVDCSLAPGKPIVPIFGEEQLRGTTGIAWKRSFNVADSKWTIVCRAAPAFLKNHRQRVLTPWFILAVCLLITLIAALYIDNLVRRASIVQALVEQKTEELKVLHAQLAQQFKIAAIGQLAGGVAHEINNPLAGILNNLQLIKMKMGDGRKFEVAEFKETLQVMEKSGLRCKNIVKSLIDFSGPSSEYLEPVSLNDLVAKARELVSEKLKINHIDFIEELEPDMPKIIGDRRLLQRAVFDLLSNSCWAIGKKKRAFRRYGADKDMA